MKVRDLGVLTSILTCLMLLDSISLPASALTFRAFHPVRSLETRAVIEQILFGLVGLRLVTAIVFVRWVYVAGANLVATGFDQLYFSPAKRVWMFFLPLYNLIMPFFGMRELWTASHYGQPNANNATLVGAWWFLWVAGGLLTALLINLGPDALGGWAPYFLIAYWVVQAGIAVILIRRIAKAQHNMSRPKLDEIFA